MLHERLKQIRSAYHLTQQQFAERLGITRNTIATYETGKSNPSDAAVSLICGKFNVSEEWLRTGQGEMFLPEQQDEISQLAKKYNLEPAIRVFIQKLVTLPPQQRKIVSDLIMETALEISQIEDQEEEDSIDQQVEAYRRALELEKEAKGKSEAI